MSCSCKYLTIKRKTAHEKKDSDRYRTTHLSFLFSIRSRTRKQRIHRESKRKERWLSLDSTDVGQLINCRFLLEFLHSVTSSEPTVKGADLIEGIRTSCLMGERLSCFFFCSPTVLTCGTAIMNRSISFNCLVNDSNGRLQVTEIDCCALHVTCSWPLLPSPVFLSAVNTSRIRRAHKQSSLVRRYNLLPVIHTVSLDEQLITYTSSFICCSSRGTGCQWMNRKRWASTTCYLRATERDRRKVMRGNTLRYPFLSILFSFLFISRKPVTSYKRSVGWWYKREERWGMVAR